MILTREKMNRYHKAFLLSLLVSLQANAQTMSITENPCTGCEFVAVNQDYVHYTNHIYHIENISGKPEEHKFCYDDVACDGNKDLEKRRVSFACDKVIVYPGNPAVGYKQMLFTINYNWEGWCKFSAHTTLFDPSGKQEAISTAIGWFEVTRWGQGRVSSHDAPQEGDG